jgi:hypothetical protein
METGFGERLVDATCQVPALCKDGVIWSGWAPTDVFGRRIACLFELESCVSESLHPVAPHHLPGFITAPGDTDVLMIAVGIFLIGAILAVGNLYLHLHTLPERMAHKSKKLQFEIVAVLGLLALFTHNHLFWVIGLFLALIDLPDFITPLRRIAGSVDKLAGVPPEAEESDMPSAVAAHAVAAEGPDTAKVRAAKREVQGHV